MTFLCYPSCSTCRKAQSWLDSRGLSYEVRHIKEQNPSYDELREWQARSGLPLKRFFNTSGMGYRALNLKERLPGMSGEEQLRLLASDGMLVKRPILICDRGILVGFKEKEWELLIHS